MNHQNYRLQWYLFSWTIFILFIVGVIIGIVFLSVAIHNWESNYKFGSCQPLALSKNITVNDCYYRKCQSVDDETTECWNERYTCYRVHWIGYIVDAPTPKPIKSTYESASHQNANDCFERLKTGIGSSTHLVNGT